jgi:hypothetical protein
MVQGPAKKTVPGSKKAPKNGAPEISKFSASFCLNILARRYRAKTSL